jgi:drug/metabolite transporter (DMT)-like permease
MVEPVNPELMGTKKADRKFVFLLLIPTMLDLISGALANIALTMVPASIYLMMRGNVFVFITIMSIFYLKMRFYRHHWLGLTFCIGGILLVGSAALGGDLHVKPIGIILLVIA